MKSPCANRCRLNPVTEYCDGCRRSLNEIKNWTTYSIEQRMAIMKNLKTRKIK